MNRLNVSFFTQDALDVAQQLIGKIIVRRFEAGPFQRYRITETEAYRGEEDLACHASKGRTPRTEIMYQSGGKVYVYFIYGRYWMLNFVTNANNFPAAVLIRSIENCSGPGRVGRELQLDKSFYGECLDTSNRIWIEEDGFSPTVLISKRIGVAYSGEWANRPWRFVDETFKKVIRPDF